MEKTQGPLKLPDLMNVCLAHTIWPNTRQKTAKEKATAKGKKRSSKSLNRSRNMRLTQRN